MQRQLSFVTCTVAAANASALIVCCGETSRLRGCVRGSIKRDVEADGAEVKSAFKKCEISQVAPSLPVE